MGLTTASDASAMVSGGKGPTVGVDGPMRQGQIPVPLVVDAQET